MSTLTVDDINEAIALVACGIGDTDGLERLREARKEAGLKPALDDTEITRAVNVLSKKTYTEGDKFTEMMEAVRKQEGGVKDLPTDQGKHFESSPVRLAKEALVRNKDGTVNVCIITPGWGNSGWYSEDLLKDSVGVFTEGLHMYWDHPTLSEEFQRPERSLRDLAGALAENAEWKGTGFNGPGIYSTAKVRSPFNEELEDLAEHIGVSVVVYAMSHQGEIDGTQGDIIDKIVAARSVDFVTLPGRGGKIEAKFESLREAGGKEEDKDDKEREEDRVVDEAERKKLEAERDAAVQRAEAAEKENATLKQDNERKTEALAIRDARSFAVKKLSAVEGVPEITVNRLADRISSSPPLKDDGSLDTERMESAVTAALKSEAEYLESIGFGDQTDLGPSGGGDGGTDEATQKRIESSFSRLGLKDGKLKTATEGRR